MGFDFEVWDFRETTAENVSDRTFDYILIHEGNDYDEALAVMHKLKDEGSLCVKFMWRG